MRAGYLPGRNLGQVSHGLIPHQNFAIIGQRTHPHRQALQRLAVITARVILLTGQTAEAVTEALRPLLTLVIILMLFGIFLGMSMTYENQCCSRWTYR